VTKAKADSTAADNTPGQTQQESTRAERTKTSGSEDEDDDDYGPALPESLGQRKSHGPRVPTLEDIQDRRGMYCSLETILRRLIDH